MVAAIAVSAGVLLSATAATVAFFTRAMRLAIGILLIALVIAAVGACISLIQSEAEYRCLISDRYYTTGCH